MIESGVVARTPRKSGFWRKYAVVFVLVCAWGLFGVDVFHVPVLYAAAVVAFFSLLVSIPVFFIANSGVDVRELEKEMGHDRAGGQRHDVVRGIVEPE